MNKTEFVANVLYKAALEEEKDWRKEKNSKYDVALADKMLAEAKKLGYHYKYFADITNRMHTDESLLRLIMSYIGRFHDEGISAQLVGVIGNKGNTFATEVILNNYIKASSQEKHNQAIFYDNALYRIKDKRYLSVYLDFLKNPEDAIKLPLTMRMLGRWRVAEAKPYFLQYLASTLLYINKETSDLVYTAMEALSYYDDPGGMILARIQSKKQSSDKNVVRAAEKAIKRLQKQDSLKEL
jgi:hypothetical protein